VVVNPKIDDLDIRQKERLAYNSAAIDQHEVAITLYKEVIAAEPNNSYAKFSLAVIYQKLGQFRQAKTLYYQLLKTAPDIYQEVITNLLTILIEESPKEAAYLLSRLANENSQSDYIAAQAAIAYERIKEHTRAIIMIKKAIELAPDNLLYKYNLAVMYDKAEKSKEAVEAYNLLLRNYRQNDDKQQEIPIEQVQSRIKTLKNKD
jgi:Flp pilus assembly protein TadD